MSWNTRELPDGRSHCSNIYEHMTLSWLYIYTKQTNKQTNHTNMNEKHKNI